MTTNTKLNELDFLKMADTLNQSEQYRVITKYNKPEFYNLCADLPKKIGVFLDIEATGVKCNQLLTHYCNVNVNFPASNKYKKL